jgi:hypothetical protein
VWDLCIVEGAATYAALTALATAAVYVGIQIYNIQNPISVDAPPAPLPSSESESGPLAPVGGTTTAPDTTATEDVPVKQGTSGGPRAGKNFTPKGKQQVIEANRQANGGQVVCENCGVVTVPSQKSQQGVTPPQNEAQVDHINAKSKGGDGAPSNGQVLCRQCNRDKWDD